MPHTSLQSALRDSWSVPYAYPKYLRPFSRIPSPSWSKQRSGIVYGFGCLNALYSPLASSPAPSTLCRSKKKIRLGNYPVFKGTSLRNILLIQLIIRLKPAGFTHTDHIGAVDQITAFISRHMAAQKCNNLGKLLSAYVFSTIQISAFVPSTSVILLMLTVQRRERRRIQQDMTCRRG